MIDDNWIRSSFQLFKGLNGGLFFEMQPGKFKGEYWSENSVYIDETGIEIIFDILTFANEDFDFYGLPVHYDQIQLKKLKSELGKRLENLLKGNINYRITDKCTEEYYSNLSDYIKRFRFEIIEMLKELIVWLNSIEEDQITVIPI